FVYDNKSPEFAHKAEDTIKIQKVAGWIIWTAKEYGFHRWVCVRPYRFNVELKVACKGYASDTDVIYIRTYSVHAVCGFGDQYDVLRRFTKCTDNQVNSFIASVSQKNILHGYTLQLGDSLFQFLLQRIGIPVVR